MTRTSRRAGLRFNPVMRGLFVAGTGPDAGELEVAAAIRSAAGGSAATFEASDYDGGAPPAIAARHAGSEIDPAAVVEAAKGAAQGADPLVAVSSGGVLGAPPHPHPNRDPALGLGLPPGVGVPAPPRLVDAALLPGGTARRARPAGAA